MLLRPSGLFARLNPIRASSETLEILAGVCRYLVLWQPPKSPASVPLLIKPATCQPGAVGLFLQHLLVLHTGRISDFTQGAPGLQSNRTPTPHLVPLDYLASREGGSQQVHPRSCLKTPQPPRRGTGSELKISQDSGQLCGTPMGSPKHSLGLFQV